MSTPFLLLGDHPALPTGLGRIARDVAHGVIGDVQAGLLPALDVVQVGWREEPGWEWAKWPVYQLTSLPDDWGASVLQGLWAQRWGNTPGILMTIWDPIRCFEIARMRGPWDRWGYFPIDAWNANGGLSGPASEVVARYDRVLGYGRWGSQVLKSARPGPVSYLPHGLELHTWKSWDDDEEHTFASRFLGPRFRADHVLIGTVASNQPRKDWGVVAQTLQLLRQRGVNAYGWWHTDEIVGKAWSLVQLVEDCGLGRKVTITTPRDGVDDSALAALYRRCAVTVAPGLGEGFGYPIVESLAAGTPCVHSTYGGGTELVPRPEWTIPVRMERLESPHAVRRPVYSAEDFANAVMRAMEWQAQVGEGIAREYCRGAVAHLEWSQLWPRWRSWIRQGLEG